MLAGGLSRAVPLLRGGGTARCARTALVRHERDVSRMVYNDNIQLLDEVKKSSGALDDSLAIVASGAADATPTTKPYLVVSIEDHRLWYKLRDSVLFTAPGATGSGKVLESGGAGSQWKFETPRGRLVVQAKTAYRAYIPPDLHLVEQARN